MAVVASELKLHTLNFGVLHIDDAHQASEIAAVSPSLWDLTITLAFLPKSMFLYIGSESKEKNLTFLPLYAVIPSIGLHTLVNLRSLHLIILPLDLVMINMFITDLLWNLPSIHLEAITLKFLPIFDTVERCVVNPLKPPPRLPQLKKLHISFNFDNLEQHSWVGEMLRRQFSLYNKRGVLMI